MINKQEAKNTPDKLTTKLLASLARDNRIVMLRLRNKEQRAIRLVATIDGLTMNVLRRPVMIHPAQSRLISNENLEFGKLSEKIKMRNFNRGNLDKNGQYLDLLVRIANDRREALREFADLCEKWKKGMNTHK